MFSSPLCIAITSLGEERANLKCFSYVCSSCACLFCLFPLPLGVWEGLRLVVEALPGFFSCLFLIYRAEKFLMVHRMSEH